MRRRYWFIEAEQNPERQMAYSKQGRQGHGRPDQDLHCRDDHARRLPASTTCRLHAGAGHHSDGEIRREFRILDYVRPRTKDRRNYWAQCPSCARASTDKSQDNLAIQIADPRFYKCWAGCTKEDIRAALGQPVPSRRFA